MQFGTLIELDMLILLKLRPTLKTRCYDVTMTSQLDGFMIQFLLVSL